MIWQPVLDGYGSKYEVDEHWSLDDLIEARIMHLTLNSD